jgi:hypothetical protein
LRLSGNSPSHNRRADPELKKGEQGAIEMKDKVLEVGTNGRGEVLVNHPNLEPDADGVGHIVFSPNQARNLATLLIGKANDADAELLRGMK